MSTTHSAAGYAGRAVFRSGRALVLARSGGAEITPRRIGTFAGDAGFGTGEMRTQGRIGGAA